MPVIGGVVILEVEGAVGIPTDDLIPVVEVVVTIFACGHSETRRGIKKTFELFQLPSATFNNHFIFVQ